MGIEAIIAMLVATVAASAISAGAGAAGTEGNKQAIGAANEKNLWLTWLQMQREDNAVQRRVKDLQKAGLSPVLAAGSPAASNATYKVTPETKDYSFIQQGMGNLQNAAMLAAQMMTQKAQIKNLDANSQYINTKNSLDLLNNKQKMSNVDASTANLISTAALNNVRKQQEAYDLKYQLTRGQKPGKRSYLGGMVDDVSNPFWGIINQNSK